MRKRTTTEDIIKRAKKTHGYRYFYDQTKYKVKEKILIGCRIHGYFWQNPFSHIKGQGCPDCGYISNARSKCKIITVKEFAKRANKIHENRYDYGEIFGNIKIKNRKIKIPIICPAHGKFKQSARNHLNGYGCHKCGQILAVKNKQKIYSKKFIDKACKLYNNKYDYSKTEYIKASLTVIIICPIHGEFKQSPNSHLGGRGCRLCGIDTRAKMRTHTFKKFVKMAKDIHDSKYEYDETNFKNRNKNKKIRVKCPIHGWFKQRFGCHLSGKGCYECGLLLRAKSKRKTTKQFVKKALAVHEDRFDYSKVKYEYSRKKVEIICPNHGSFWQTPEGHLSGRGCKECTYFVSKQETEWLDSINLPRGKKYRNVTLKVGKKHYRVDGFDPNTNMIYEFYGDYWHGNPNKYCPNDINKNVGESFGQLYEKTINRENAIKKSGFDLVIIWESEWKRLKATLEKQA